MHPILARQLNRSGFSAEVLPSDPAGWNKLLGAVTNAYEQADQDRYFLERALSLSSEEMGELHKALAAERDTFRAVICALVEGVCAVDAEGRTLFINPVARRLLGIAPDADVTGKRLTDLTRANASDGTGLEELLRIARASESEDPARICAPGDRLVAEPQLLVGGRDDPFITYSLAPLGQQSGGTVLTVRDISRRKRMEREQQELNRRLVEVSRQAGMAEVASDVLHNVGNVLNSVNVACCMAIEVARSTKQEGVTRLARLLQDNRGRLGNYLQEDPTGTKIPDYLTQLGEHLTHERERLLNELDGVQRSTEHIREIISTQQSFAKVQGVREFEDLIALAEEALRVAETSLDRHGVRVERRFTPVKPVLIERNLLLQVIINLINNAKQAVSGKPAGERSITFTINPDGDRVRLEVKDTGYGIAPENLTRIFSHGFTTRKEGHGFGLHSAALAAKAMGGSLDVHSDGVGRGATFTLTLPLGESQKARAA